MPVAPGSADPVADADAAVEEASRIGYPVMVKAAAGGGGIGMSAAFDDDALRSAFDTARSRAERFFGSPEILLERYVPHARHVEVQILGLADGRVIALGERDCSVQRRHQKVAEETPSPGVSASLRSRMLSAAVLAGEAVGYRGAGTVECLVDTETGDFIFLEMNTRLQVEHPVTELVTGIDLVEQQFLIAAGEPVSFDASVPVDVVRARARAARLRGGPEAVPAQPRAHHGMVGARLGLASGWTAGTRRAPRSPCSTTRCWPSCACTGPPGRRRCPWPAPPWRTSAWPGLKTNLPFHAELLDNPEFVSGDYDTGLVSRMRQS